MRTLPVVSNKQAICLSCREKQCCSYYTVAVTTHDLVRIARAMQLAPSDFLTCQKASDEGSGGFLLRPDGPKHTIALRKRRLSDETASPCIFLLRTNDQHGVCGLGDLRPALCHTFPTYLIEGFVAIAHNPPGCVRTWSYGDIDVEEQHRALTHAHGEEVAHEALVEQWNGQVRSDGRERPFEEFCAFLINHAEELEVSR
jgi:Fe-S-cluster containining protein